MEENKVAQITKHPDSSRSTDSGVSGNAQTGAGEIRERIGEALIWLLDEKYHDDAANELAPDFAKYAAFYAQSECSRLASRVEELETSARAMEEVYRRYQDRILDLEELLAKVTPENIHGEK